MIKPGETVWYLVWPSLVADSQWEQGVVTHVFPGLTKRKTHTLKGASVRLLDANGTKIKRPLEHVRTEEGHAKLRLTL